METYLSRSDKLSAMVRQGIPHSLRPQLWLRLSGAMKKKLACDLSYKDVVKASSNDHIMTSKQIEKVFNTNSLLYKFNPVSINFQCYLL